MNPLPSLRSGHWINKWDYRYQKKVECILNGQGQSKTANKQNKTKISPLYWEKKLIQIQVHWKGSGNTAMQSLNDRDPLTRFSPAFSIYNILFLLSKVSTNMLHWHREVSKRSGWDCVRMGACTLFFLPLIYRTENHLKIFA